MKLKFRKFLMPDGNPGGGSAVAEPPPAGGTDTVDPLTYSPPAPEALEEFLSAPEGTKPPAATISDPVKKDAAPKVDDAAAKAASDKAASEKAAAEKATKDKADADAAAKKEPASKQLRDQLGKLEARAAELEKQLEAAKSDKRVDELSKKIEANEAAIREREEQIADRDKKLLIHNPHVAKPLNDLKEAFNAEYAGYIDQVPRLQNEFRPMLDEFEGLPRGTAEYADKLTEFRENLKQAWGDDAPVVYEALRRGLKFRQDYGTKFKEVQENALAEDFKGKRSEWEKASGTIKTEFPKWFEPPADANETDPMHPVLFLKNFEALLPPDYVKNINNTLLGMVDRAFNGAQPKTKADFAGLTDEQISQELVKQEFNVKTSRAVAMRTAAIGGKVLAYLRPILAEYAKMRDKVEELTKSLPPDPTKTPGSEAGSATTGDDVANYQAPPIDENAALG